MLRRWLLVVMAILLAGSAMAQSNRRSGDHAFGSENSHPIWTTPTCRNHG